MKRINFGWTGAAITACFLWGIQAPAAANCQLEKLSDIPLVKSSDTLWVDLSVSGHVGHFLLNSGIARSRVTQNYLAILRSGDGSRVEQGSQIILRQIDLGGVSFAEASFAIVAADPGRDGSIGQDLLSATDVEFDVPGGRLRMFRPNGCGQATLAYWAAGQPVSAIPILGGRGSATLINVVVNGVTLRAALSSSMSQSVVAKAAAARIEIDLDGPDAKQAGSDHAAGPTSPVWEVPITSVKIGDETLPDRRMLIEPLPDGIDMLIGADFLASHRVYVSNEQRMMYFTRASGSPAQDKSPADQSNDR